MNYSLILPLAAPPTTTNSPSHAANSMCRFSESVEWAEIRLMNAVETAPSIVKTIIINMFQQSASNGDG